MKAVKFHWYVPKLLGKNIIHDQEVFRVGHFFFQFF